MGACAGDVDGDRLPDLYITAIGPNALYRNRGNGPVEQPGSEHLRRQRQAGLFCRDVQRRQAEQVPEVANSSLGLPGVPQPRPERPLVQRAVGRIQAPQRQRSTNQVRLLRSRQEWIPGEGRPQMERCRKPGPAEPGGPAPRRDHRDVHLRLQPCQVAHPEPVEEAAVGGAAAQEDVLAGVDRQALPDERRSGAAQPGLRFEQRHRRSGVGAGDGGGEAGQAPAHHEHAGTAHAGAPGKRARARAATAAFSHPGREIRRRSTDRGSAVMRRSSRR